MKLVIPQPFGGLVIPPARGAAAALVSFVTTANDNDNNTNYSISGVSIGAAAADRRVFALLCWSSTATGARTLNSASIGGVSATIHVQDGMSDSGQGGLAAAIVSAAVPTGTTATIAASLSGQGGSLDVGVYRVTGLGSATPHDTQSNTVSNGAPSVSLNVPARGFVLAVVNHAATSSGNTWVGVDEDYDYDNGDGSPEIISGGHAQNLAAQSGRTVSATGASGVSVMVAGSWA